MALTEVPTLRAANEEFRQGNYVTAARMYLALLQDGFFTTSICINLGIARKRATLNSDWPDIASTLQVIRGEAPHAEQMSKWIETTTHDWCSIPLRCALGAAYPLLSVVVPCYNSGAILNNTIVDMLTSRAIPFEMIIVDDGSTDGSYEQLKALVDRFVNITIMRQRNSGAGNARNRAIPHCKGMYTFFLDADDQLDISELSKAVHYAMTVAADLIFLPYRLFFEGRRQFSEMYDEDQLVFRAAAHRNLAQSELQQLACDLIGFPWNRIVSTRLLHRQKIRFCNTPVHNDMLFHWQSIVSSERICFWQGTVCTHNKYDSGSLSSNSGRHRLAVFDAMTITFETLKADSVFLRHRDIWNRVSRKTIEWNRLMLSADIHSQFEAALDRFKKTGIVADWSDDDTNGLVQSVTADANTGAANARCDNVPQTDSEGLINRIEMSAFPSEVAGIPHLLYDNVRWAIKHGETQSFLDSKLLWDLLQINSGLSKEATEIVKKLIVLLRLDEKELRC